MLTVFKNGQNKIKQEFDALLNSKATLTPAAATAPAFTPKTTAEH
jgi:hypothetical protein